jgi:hypothetical protein
VSLPQQDKDSDLSPKHLQSKRMVEMLIQNKKEVQTQRNRDKLANSLQRERNKLVTGSFEIAPQVRASSQFPLFNTAIYLQDQNVKVKTTSVLEHPTKKLSQKQSPVSSSKETTPAN